VRSGEPNGRASTGSDQRADSNFPFPGQNDSFGDKRKGHGLAEWFTRPPCPVLPLSCPACTGSGQQGEFLKDVSALANTYSAHYRNHGFLSFGAAKNSLLYTSFPNTEDHIQAPIDELIKRYLGPFITTHLFVFNDSGKSWGALVVPPWGDGFERGALETAFPEKSQTQPTLEVVCRISVTPPEFVARFLLSSE
jgi:hypothetical protein